MLVTDAVKAVKTAVACGSDGKESACNVGHLSSIPGSGRSPGEENGNPLQYSCLETLTDRGAWRATVHGDANKSDTPEQLILSHQKIIKQNKTSPCSQIKRKEGAPRGAGRKRGRRCVFPGPVCSQNLWEKLKQVWKFCLLMKPEEDEDV